jgi:hypothetical protein
VSPPAAEAGPQSVRELMAVARRQRVELGAILTDFAIERILHRVGSSTMHAKVALGGATLLRALLPDVARRTSAVELYTAGELGAIADALRDSLQGTSEDLSFELPACPERPPPRGAAGIRLQCAVRIASADVGIMIVVRAVDELVTIPLDTFRPLLRESPAPRLLALTPERAAAEIVAPMISAGVPACPLFLVYDLSQVLRRIELAGTAIIEALHKACPSLAFQPHFPDVFTSLLPRTRNKRSQWNALYRSISPLRTSDSIPTLDSEYKLLNEFFHHLHVPMVLHHDSFPFIWPPGGPWKKISRN